MRFQMNYSPIEMTVSEDAGKCPCPPWVTFFWSVCKLQVRQNVAHLLELLIKPKNNVSWDNRSTKFSKFLCSFILCASIFNSYMSLVVFLYLCIDSSLPCGLIQLPLGDLEEVGCLPEAHLPGADHVNGVLKSLILGELGTINGNPLVFKSGLGNTTW